MTADLESAWPRRMATLLFTATLSAPAAALDVASALPQIEATLAGAQAQLAALYQHLHSHPELAFQETGTAARLASEMRALGFEVSEKVGRTGLVAIYRNGTGPTVMVRTDLDGLPVEERTDLPYASRARTAYNGAETSVMHACGHDLHMSIWVGTARALLSQKQRWRGTLMFIGQPAEESVRGARAMLEDGLFTRFGKPDQGFALHVLPIANNEVVYRSGAITSNGSSFEVRFNGRGGHGSNPSETIDPVMMAGRFIVDVQSIVSREKDPAAFGVVSIGAVQGGSAGNIIPDNVVLRGTVRSQADEVQEKLHAGVRRTATAVAAMAGAPAPDITISPGVKSVINDAALTSRVAPVFTAAFGERARALSSAWSGGEDYTEFVTAGVPSLYFGVGIYDPARVAAARASGVPMPANHSPQFAPTDPLPTLRTGITAMTLAVLTALERQPGGHQAR